LRKRRQSDVKKAVPRAGPISAESVEYFAFDWFDSPLETNHLARLNTVFCRLSRAVNTVEKIIGINSRLTKIKQNLPNFN